MVPDGRRTNLDEFIVACRKLTGLAYGIDNGSINNSSSNWEECMDIGDDAINQIMSYIYDIPSCKSKLVQQFGYYLNAKDITELKLECEKELLHQELDIKLREAHEFKIREEEEVLKIMQEEEDAFWEIVKEQMQADAQLLNHDGYDNLISEHPIESTNIHDNGHSEETKAQIEKLNKLWLID